MVHNGVVTLSRDADGRKVGHITADKRHVEVIYRSLGFNAKTKAVTTSSTKLSDSKFTQRHQDPDLQGGSRKCFTGRT